MLGRKATFGTDTTTQENEVTTRKVENPNKKGNTAFIWAIAAVVAIALLVIGIIIFNGRNQRSEAMQEDLIDSSGITVEYADGSDVIKLISSNADAPMADLFEDYSCSHCAELHQATDAEMIEALKAGDINVELRPMVAQDRGTVGHATKSLAAFLALISHGDNDVAFTLRDYLYSNQAQVFNTLEYEDLAKMAQDWGASKDAVNDIRDGKFEDAATKMGEDNLKYQQDNTGDAWTPRVLIDGKDAEDLGAGREDWVETLKNS